MKNIILLGVTLLLSSGMSAKASPQFDYWCSSGDFDMSLTISDQDASLWKANSDWSYHDRVDYQGNVQKNQNGFITYLMDDKNRTVLQIPASLIEAKPVNRVAITFDGNVYWCL